MKSLLTLLAAVALAFVISGCHDHEGRAHTTTTTTESSSTRIAPAAESSTTVSTYR